MKFRFLELLNFYMHIYSPFNFNFCARRPFVRSFVAAFVLRIVHFSLFVVFVLRLVSSSLRSSTKFIHIPSCVCSFHSTSSATTDRCVYIRIVRMPLLIHSMRWQHRDGFSSVHCFTFRTMHNKMKILVRHTKGETKNSGHFRKYSATLQRTEKSRG